VADFGIYDVFMGSAIRVSCDVMGINSLFFIF
jgi:hypothetical protein